MKIVAALGRNALGENPTEQNELLKEAPEFLSQLFGLGHQMVFVHGNGPQVGMISEVFDGKMSLSEITVTETKDYFKKGTWVKSQWDRK